MSAKRGPGRPKLAKGVAKKQIFAIRLTAQERTLVNGAAAYVRAASASDWAREVLMAAAKEIRTSRRRSRAQKEGRRIRAGLEAAGAEWRQRVAADAGVHEGQAVPSDDASSNDS